MYLPKKGPFHLEACVGLGILACLSVFSISSSVLVVSNLVRGHTILLMLDGFEEVDRELAVLKVHLPSNSIFWTNCCLCLGSFVIQLIGNVISVAARDERLPMQFQIPIYLGLVFYAIGGLGYMASAMMVAALSHEIELRLLCLNQILER